MSERTAHWKREKRRVRRSRHIAPWRPDDRQYRPTAPCAAWIRKPTGYCAMTDVRCCGGQRPGKPRATAGSRAGPLPASMPDRIWSKGVVEVVRTDAEQTHLWTSGKLVTNKSSWPPPRTSLDCRAEGKPELSRNCRLRRERRLTAWRPKVGAEFSAMEAEALTDNLTLPTVLP